MLMFTDESTLTRQEAELYCHVAVCGEKRLNEVKVTWRFDLMSNPKNHEESGMT